MAKTYTLTSTGIYGAKRSWTDSYWSNMSVTENDSYARCYGGYASSVMYCTNVSFSASVLATLKSKTVTSIKLKMYCTSIPSTSATRIGLKYNSQRYTTSSGNAWATCNASGSLASTPRVAFYSGSDNWTKSGYWYTIDVTSLGVPTYGYVFGPTSQGYDAIAQFAQAWSSSNAATLTVITNETDYTLSYSANGGTGAPSAQTGTGAGSYTFTLSSAAPTRTGYTFLGWSTSSTATAAAYQPGGTVTVSASITLYAVWQIITYSVSYHANGGTGAPGAQTKTYGVTLTLSSAAPTRTGYAFLGWATSSTATAAAYQPGGTYTQNAALALYAVWRKTASIYYGATAGEPVTGGVTGTAYLAADGQLREGNGIW